MPSFLAWDKTHLEEKTNLQQSKAKFKALFCLYVWQNISNDIHYRSKVGVFILKEINTFIHQGRIKLIKSDGKDIYNVTKDSISNKCCSSELSIHQKILKKCINNQIYLILCWSSNHHIRMISEGSCDTEDWSNDAENSALITGINYTLLYIFT